MKSVKFIEKLNLGLCPSPLQGASNRTLSKKAGGYGGGPGTITLQGK